MIYNGLPVYEAIIADENCGLFKTSFVSDPATEVNWVAFDAEKPFVKFSVDNAVERMVSGIIMLASTPIYRRTADNFEYYIMYSKETLKIMAEKMIFDGVGSNVNIQHQDGSDVDGVNLVELYVIDREKGINPLAFENVPDGSLVGTYKVHNDDVWAMIENGDVLSFSLEGVFQVEETFAKEEQNNNNEKYNKAMTKLSKIKEVLKSLLVEFGEVSTDKGVIVFDGDELVEGMTVKGIDENGDEVELANGEYRTEDKKIVVVEDGKVVEIRDDEAEVSTDEPAAEPEQEPQENEDENTDPEPEVDEKDALIEELKARIAELEAENEELKEKVGNTEQLMERIAELEKEPAALSANEEFEKADKKQKTKADELRDRGYKF